MIGLEQVFLHIYTHAPHTRYKLSNTATSTTWYPQRLVSYERKPFNDSGNLIALTDELGYDAFSKYTTSGPLNKPEAVSRLQRSVVSMVRDPLFAGNVWQRQTVGDGSITYAYDTAVRYLETRSLKISRTDDAGTWKEGSRTMKTGDWIPLSCSLLRMIQPAGSYTS